MSAAAIFDLDRTLLPGSSGPILADELRRVGVVKGSASSIERLLFAVFDAVGETRPSMLLTRQGVRLTAGWDRKLVRKAGQRAARRLIDAVQPYAWREFAMHREAGRQLVLATTSPDDLAAPLATALGFDAVIATRYGRNGASYDGTVDGHFVWGKGKRAAVEEWAARTGVDLSESYAYSDSYYDLPLLSAVGHPVAVNPDPRLTLVARARRWSVRNLDVPIGVPKLAGIEPAKALTFLARPELLAFVRFDIKGTAKLPADGAVIVAANHRSYFDPAALAIALAQRGRVGRFLAKRELFDAPLVGNVMSGLGSIRVDRGSGSGAPLAAAAEALAAGESVVILPQGTIPRGEAFFEPQLVGRKGVATLARMTGAPVVPVGLWGTEAVWPRSAKVPQVWNVLRPPTVRVRVGAPVKLSGRSDEADVAKIMRAIEALLPKAARVRPAVTEAMLARTFPSGKIR